MLRKEIIINRNFSGEVTAPNEAKDFIIQAVGNIVVDDKPTLIAMLNKSGVLVTDLNTQTELTDATFKAIRDSSTFRNDLQDYLTSVGQAVYSGQEENSNFLNQTGVGKFLSNLGGGIKNLFKTKQGGSAFGNAVRDNLSTAMGLGIGVLGAKLTNDANRGAGQQAIDYTNAQSQLEYVKGQNALIQQNAPASTTPTKETPKWVLPVAIGGGVLILGVIIYFAVRNK